MCSKYHIYITTLSNCQVLERLVEIWGEFTHQLENWKKSLSSSHIHSSPKGTEATLDPSFHIEISIMTHSPHLMPLYVYLDLASVLLYIHNLSTIFYLCKTRKRSLKINRNSHRLELETPPKDYTLAHWSTQYENQFTLSFFYSGKKNKQKHRFP